MNPKRAHNLVQIPLLIIALAAMGLGISWIFSAEPWMLDQQANEALLGVDFHTLFQTPVNQNLPDYLRLSYRFFGWWMFSIGLLIGGFVQVTRMGTRLARTVLHSIMILILIGLYRIEFIYIPDSPFLFLTHGLVLLVLISIIGSIGLGKTNRE
ncbi:MAG: hypothetical protein GXO90_03865 [FCB group bacterium]|nr:hypothetical protein [FCB group bacterium]